MYIMSSFPLETSFSPRKQPSLSYTIISHNNKITGIVMTLVLLFVLPVLLFDFPMCSQSNYHFILQSDKFDEVTTQMLRNIFLDSYSRHYLEINMWKMQE